jgi:hypothetical protein
VVSLQRQTTEYDNRRIRRADTPATLPTPQTTMQECGSIESLRFFNNATFGRRAIFSLFEYFKEIILSGNE